MKKEAAITVRIPATLKRRLARTARRERRSMSAQVQHALEQAVALEPDEPVERRPALGMFAGARLPSDNDILEVRAALWGELGKRDG
jgi:hypothetical protein